MTSRIPALALVLPLCLLWYVRTSPEPSCFDAVDADDNPWKPATSCPCAHKTNCGSDPTDDGLNCQKHFVLEGHRV